MLNRVKKEIRDVSRRLNKANEDLEAEKEISQMMNAVRNISRGRD